MRSSSCALLSLLALFQETEGQLLSINGCSVHVFVPFPVGCAISGSGFSAVVPSPENMETSQEPVKSIEDDNKGDGQNGAPIPDDLWRIMMDVVLTIYEVREEE